MTVANADAGTTYSITIEAGTVELGGSQVVPASAFAEPVTASSNVFYEAAFIVQVSNRSMAAMMAAPLSDESWANVSNSDDVCGVKAITPSELEGSIRTRNAKRCTGKKVLVQDFAALDAPRPPRDRLCGRFRVPMLPLMSSYRSA